MNAPIPPREVLSNPPPRYHTLDLFSGIGGFSLGLHRSGFTTEAFCEIDPYCRKILAKHWPKIKIHDDIKLLDGNQYVGSIDVICGGYPCQPFSAAGKQQGEKDPRHLWPEMHRIIREACPRWVICENVRGHVSLGFDTVAAQLEDDGFTVWPFIVPACAVAGPHRRDRLWIVAHHSGNGRGAWRQGRFDSSRQGEPEQALQSVGNAAGAGLFSAALTGVHRQTEGERPRDAESERRGQPVADADGQREPQPQGGIEGFRGRPGHSRQTLADSVCPGLERHAGDGDDEHKSRRIDSESNRPASEGGLCGAMANTDCKPSLGSAIAREERDSWDAESGVGRSDDGLSGGLDFTGRWADGSWEAGIPRVASGVPNRVQRLKALGNTVVPEIPYRIGLAIRGFEQNLTAAA